MDESIIEGKRPKRDYSNERVRKTCKHLAREVIINSLKNKNSLENDSSCNLKIRIPIISTQVSPAVFSYLFLSHMETHKRNHSQNIKPPTYLLTKT